MGDFVQKFARPDTGTNTVEGQVSGNLAAIHAKKREKQQKEFEEKKAKIEADAKRGTKKIDEKFEQVRKESGGKPGMEYRPTIRGRRPSPAADYFLSSSSTFPGILTRRPWRKWTSPTSSVS